MNYAVGIVACVCSAVLVHAQPDIGLQQLASGYTRACDVVNAGDERLFVVQQDGIIDVVYRDGTQQEQPFLDITDRVQGNANERGLLGLAFPPDFCQSGRFYVNYTAEDSNNTAITRISRFLLDTAGQGDADSEEVLIEFEQPFTNHNGGQLEFGPDGYLYIATGDGGSGGDPLNNSQDRSNLLGNLLRIDVSGEEGYTIPADNPYVDQDSLRAEIWAYGLRNPWKFAFDALNGDLFIADVGQNEWEEVNYLSAGEGAGANFGWRCYEGNDEFDLSLCDPDGDYTFPVFVYNHSQGCSITGGRVYRGQTYDFYGKYLCADLCSGQYWLLHQEDGEWVIETGEDIGTTVLAFGEDIYGEMYAVSGSTINRVRMGDEPFLPPLFQSADDSIQSLITGQSYTWLLNGEVLSTGTEQEIGVTQSGTYGLILTTAAGCVLDTVFVDATITGLAEQPAGAALKLYPNPNSGNVTVDLPSVASEMAGGRAVQVAIYDSRGRLLLQQMAQPGTSVQLDLSFCSAGLYLVEVRSADKLLLARHKMVINY